jgi:3-isopropylmalate dehydratase/3-isopropylmalate/(R)-2-methylmalate dehydratase small subunit
MTKFERLTGIAATLPTANIDTDQIIPKQFLKTIDRTGLAKGLFHDFRFDANGNKKADFVLNQPPFDESRILMAGDNFGCGSSREHAPWALLDFGIRCVISSGFADIFYNNCLQNGLLPAIVTAADLQRLMAQATGGIFIVDLPEQTIVTPSGSGVPFTIESSRKSKLLQGLDAIAETFLDLPAIERYEDRRRSTWPWLEPARTLDA